MLALSSRRSSWRCQDCTFENQPERVQCEICNFSREQHRRGFGRRASMISWQPPPACSGPLCVCLRIILVSIALSVVTFVVLLGLHYGDQDQDVTIIALLVFVASVCLCTLYIARGRRAQDRQPLLTNSFLVIRGIQQRWISRSSERIATNDRMQRLPTHEVSLADVETALPEYRRCAICIDDFAVGDFQRTLPCFHRFHVTCIDEWLQRSRLCPICRIGVDSAPCDGSWVPDTRGPGGDTVKLEFAYGPSAHMEKAMGRAVVKPGTAVSFMHLDGTLQVSNIEGDNTSVEEGTVTVINNELAQCSVSLFRAPEAQKHFESPLQVEILQPGEEKQLPVPHPCIGRIFQVEVKDDTNHKSICEVRPGQRLVIECCGTPA
eukprot:TRINITY_DN20813_c0_g4_i2.p1 TRINITY_DN20813_c0_g4~~TRINITY_DN20813_c0_g4_i2.p1  ORF type:complete len:398 (-),score=30.09 TRINITY_DN20813_c0_g4_i2:24-1157(-)